MTKNTINNNLIAKNTVVLYVRMLFTLAISFFTTRELLRILGIEDFGLYNVIGGIVMMCGFLNNAMVASSQRFISFSLGEGDVNKQKRVFSTSIIIHILIAFIILLFAETIGLWFVNNKMSIPHDRLLAINVVYQTAVLSFICNIIQVPFSATVIAHERMTFYAIVSIIDAVFKLAIVYILILCNKDRLIIYGFLLLIISLFNLLSFIIYTRISFKESRFILNVDRGLFKEMMTFAGWSFVGNFGFSAKDYGVNILLNLFSGPTINAARGIAYQVMTAVNGFVINFQTAINPQITKRYACGQYDDMISLVKRGSKYSFYLLSLIVIPLFIRAEYVLDIWLDEVPIMTLQFLRLALIMVLINSMFGPLVYAIQATGNIKTFQIAIAIIMLSDLPISYVLLSKGFPPYYVMYVAILSAFIGLIARAFLLNRLVIINFRDFVFNIVIKNLILAMVMWGFPAYLSQFIPQTFIGLIVICLISVLWSLFVIWFLGLTSNEQKQVSAILRKYCKSLNLF